MPTDGKLNWYQSIERLVRYRLFVPLKRSKQPAEHSARGVAVGMFWAMSPFFGLQMTLVFLTWLFSRKLLHWDFALVPGLAWTWITNIFTLPPFFYAFYITGQIALGKFSGIQGFQAFYNLFEVAKMEAGPDFWAQMFASANVIISQIGIPLCIGSAIWAIVWSWASYYMTLRFVNEYRARRNIDSDMNNAVS